ncbi:interferon-induced protein 44-like [Ruditapes philippinarum]|uniref:interferon-induced protein 44-like n=1 Tax=Ruditapes philippinarum TaxID=129788 RepID=UPI00295B3C03|nr:interferon-induced protein 44-like [Ruditapes philippinarum]
MFGPSGHGKSAFINSVSTISTDRKSNKTNSASTTKHATSVFRRYDFEDLFYTFRIADTKGIVEFERDNKYLVENIVSIVNGHFRPGIEFKGEEFQTNGDFYIDFPVESDKVHCVILMFNMKIFVNKGALFKLNYRTLVTDLSEELNRLDIPRIVILTYADQVDEKVKNDISCIFYKEEVKKAVYTASEWLGVPVENIHPIVNYSNTVYADLNHRLHIPILLALQSALYYARDTLHKRNQI